MTSGDVYLFIAANCNKLSGLKTDFSHRFCGSGVQVHSVLQLGSHTCHPGAGQAAFTFTGEELASTLTLGTGRIPFLAAVGPRALASCWLETGDCPHLQEGTCNSQRLPGLHCHLGFPSTVTYFIRPATRVPRVSLQQDRILYNIKQSHGGNFKCERCVGQKACLHTLKGRGVHRA